MYRLNKEGKAPFLLYKTDVVRNNSNPEWSPFTVSIGKLSGGDLANGLVMFEVYDHDPVGNDLIGSVIVPFTKLFYAKEFELVHELKRKKRTNYRNSGILEIVTIELVKSERPKLTATLDKPKK